MGRSSPIVVKDRLYLTALDGDGLVTLALDATHGRLGLAPGDPAGAHQQDLRRQQHGDADAGLRRRESVRVLPRLRPRVVRRLRKRALARAARAVRELLRHLLVAGRLPRHARARVRPAGRGVRAGRGQGLGPRALANRAQARDERRLLDPDLLRAGRGTAAAHHHRSLPGRRLRPRDRREPVVDRRAGRLSDRLAGAVRRPGDRGQRGERHAGVSAVRRDAEAARHRQGRAALARGVEPRCRVQGPLRLGRHGQGRLRDAGRVGREGQGERHRARRDRQPDRRRRRPYRRPTSSGATRSRSRDSSRRSFTATSCTC